MDAQLANDLCCIKHCPGANQDSLETYSVDSGDSFESDKLLKHELGSM